jgi:hypothetical protein
MEIHDPLPPIPERVCNPLILSLAPLHFVGTFHFITAWMGICHQPIRTLLRADLDPDTSILPHVVEKTVHVAWSTLNCVRVGRLYLNTSFKLWSVANILELAFARYGSRLEYVIPS